MFDPQFLFYDRVLHVLQARLNPHEHPLLRKKVGRWLPELAHQIGESFEMIRSGKDAVQLVSIEIEAAGHSRFEYGTSVQSRPQIAVFVEGLVGQAGPVGENSTVR